MIKSKVSVFVAAILLAAVFVCPLYAAEYKDAKYGFSVNYPDSCEKQAPTPGTIFYAIAASKMPWFSVSVVEGATVQDAFKAAFSGNADFTEVEVEAFKDVAIGNGGKGQAAKLKYMWQETYECEGVTLVTQKDGKWFISSLMTVPMYDSSFSVEDYEKMLTSFKFN